LNLFNENENKCAIRLGHVRGSPWKIYGLCWVPRGMETCV